MPALINTSTTSSWPPLQAKWSGVGEDLSQSLTALSWQLSSSWTTLEETLDICSSSKLHSGIRRKVKWRSTQGSLCFQYSDPWAMMTRIHQLTQPYTYRRSGNFRVTKFSFFKFSRKNTFMVWDTHEKFLTTLNQFCIPWFSYLEWDYAHQKTWSMMSLLHSWANRGYHVAVGKLTRVDNRRTLQACTVVVKTDNLLDTELKVVTRLPWLNRWYRRCHHAQNN